MTGFRPARPEECDIVADHVHRLTIDIGAKVQPRITGAALRQYLFADPPLLHAWVAETPDGIVGSCIASPIFSTWRGVPGLYVVDLYVTPEARGNGTGEALLRALARDAWARGARFIRLDVDNANAGAARFYRRLGFHEHTGDRFYAIEPEDLDRFIRGG